MSAVLPSGLRHPRPALAFDSEDSARNNANGRRGCTVVVEALNTHVRRWWSVPLERPDALGPWRHGAHVEPDPAPVFGIARPRPYDWAKEAA